MATQNRGPPLAAFMARPEGAHCASCGMQLKPEDTECRYCGFRGWDK